MLYKAYKKLYIASRNTDMETIDITTRISSETLVQIGQAMERKGFKSMDEYLKWAIGNQTRELLEVGTEVPCSED